MTTEEIKEYLIRRLEEVKKEYKATDEIYWTKRQQKLARISELKMILRLFKD